MPDAAESSVKAKLRAEALARRDALDPAVRAGLSARIAGRAIALLRRQPPAVLAGYWPIRSECDPRPVMAEARRMGAEIVLPVVQPDGLLFRVWKEDAPLVAGALGTKVPPAGAAAGVPGTVLVPLAAFDRRGNRLGYGRGYYDRAVASLAAAGRRPLLIGLAFGTQEVATVAPEPHDVRLDFIVSEAETVSFPD